MEKKENVKNTLIATKQQQSSGPGWVAQLVGALSQYAKVVGSILGLGHIQESANGCINKWNSKSMFLCLSLLLSLKSIK